MKYMNLPRESREHLMAGLAAMPEFLDESFAQLPAALHVAPGLDDGFSPVEQVWHLADLEEMGFAERIRRLRAEPHPRLPHFAGDVVARERNYKALSLLEGIAAFRRARERNLLVFRALDPGEWVKDGDQDGVGPVSLCDLPSMMAAHDASHRREIADWFAHVEG
jgi:hypothetical protein